MQGCRGRKNRPASSIFPDVPGPPNRDDLDIEETDDVDGIPRDNGGSVPNQGEVDSETPTAEPPD